MSSLLHSNSALDPIKIIETVSVLQMRIAERFPDSGLCRVCAICLQISQQARERAKFIDRPVYWLRAAIWLFVVILTGGLIYMAISLPQRLINFTENWETIEAITNEMLLLSAGLFFLLTLENRFKRRRALSALHELRALAHVIDMHQLTKDPERLVSNWISGEHSPKMQMTAFELGRYLDYCCEMLSLTGKIAAVYVQRFDDEVALEAVNEVEMLTSSLSARIWQKTMLLNSLESRITQQPSVGTESPAVRRDKTPRTDAMPRIDTTPPADKGHEAP
ncbi:MAG: hypothetical protein O3C60_12125 [Planctomycetota bacterium]|nr:hypothetical protein [Planctomycetota bacterium]